VSSERFHQRVKALFFEIQKAWNDIPFQVMNDGEVTALAGSMALRKNRVLGLSMGTSTAGGYVNRQGHITSWINELAFVRSITTLTRRGMNGPAIMAAVCSIFLSNALGVCWPRPGSRWMPVFPCPKD